jgi:precorrin-4/cobalt-precorrin-4 C11-methyltransferase
MKTPKGRAAKKKTTVYFIGAGPGDPELITVKGRKVLEAADIVIYAGSLVNPALLAGLKGAVYDSAPMHLDEIVALMEGAAEKGLSVARLHTGDTAFYSAVSEQIERLRGLGIAYEIIPGVSSASAGAAALGQELTIPEVSQTVILTRLAGRTPVPEDEALAGLARHRASMVVFLSAGMIERVVGELLTGYPAETPCAVVEKASWPDEKIVKGTLKTIAAKVRKTGIEKTALIYVGDALKASEQDLRKESRLYHKTFRHGYRK